MLAGLRFDEQNADTSAMAGNHGRFMVKNVMLAEWGVNLEKDEGRNLNADGFAGWRELPTSNVQRSTSKAEMYSVDFLNLSAFSRSDAA